MQYDQHKGLGVSVHKERAGLTMHSLYRQFHCLTLMVSSMTLPAVAGGLRN